MNPEASIPSFAEFLVLPLDALRPLLPEALIYAASGTRRAAALAGVPTQGDAFAAWTQGELWRTVELFQRCGARHLIMPMLGPSQFDEVTADYREHLWRWYLQGLTGAPALAHYRRMGWRVRLACSEFIPALRQAGQLLAAETPPEASFTLWCYAVPDYDAPLQWLIEAARRAVVETASESIPAVQRVLYGEAIPPVTLYLGTGKPQLSSLQLPPLLARGPLQGYWHQKPGYSLDEVGLRQVLYDDVYLRRTWRADKAGRAEQSLAYRQAWQRAPILGLGTRLGPFWYPTPLEAVEGSSV